MENLKAEAKLTGKMSGKLIDYLKTQGCTKASLVKGPNGDFVSATKENGEVMTLPVGKKSQSGKLNEMNIIIDGDVVIATMNNYEAIDEITL